MSRLDEVEKQINNVEGFKVKFFDSRTDADKRGDQEKIPDYPFERPFEGEKTVERWKIVRIEEIYPAFIYVKAINGDGTPADGKCHLSTVRSTYSTKTSDNANKIELPPYKVHMSREKPGCFLFLIDQSGSMSDPFGGATGGQKSQAVANVVNEIIYAIIYKNLTGEDATEEVLNRCVIGVIGYGDTIRTAFSGNLSGINLLNLSDIYSNAKISEENNIKSEYWIDPVAKGKTPMCEALSYAHEVLSKWISQHKDSHPPVVINVTDGESTDGDPLPHAQKITSLSTEDGNILLFNCHLSSTQAHPILFPSTEVVLPDEFSRKLFEMSSILPETMRSGIPQFKSNSTRGFAFNAGLTDLVRFIKIGTEKATADR